MDPLTHDILHPMLNACNNLQMIFALVPGQPRQDDTPVQTLSEPTEAPNFETPAQNLHTEACTAAKRTESTGHDPIDLSHLSDAESCSRIPFSKCP